MKDRGFPYAAFTSKGWQNAKGRFETKARGMAVLNSPQMNKGTAFTAEERTALCLTGLLPPEITTLETQTQSAYAQYERLQDPLSKNLYLTALHDRNEVLFYSLFSQHLREMIPIVNDHTVGIALAQNHHESRRPRGMYLSIDHMDGIEDAFKNLRAGTDDIDLMLATDSERILGLGDWGLGGIEVAIGKLAIYTAAGGVDPTRVIPVMLDVGTNRENLLADPMYVGNRHARVRGERYDDFIDVYVKAANKYFPNAILQFEDFAPSNGRRILDRYRNSMATFNDAMQGTGAITLAAVISAGRVSGTPLRHQRVIIFGAGTAGIGVADQIRDAMIRDGLSAEAATRRFWCVDQQGLLTADQSGQLLDFQTAYARPASESRGWKHEIEGKGVSLAETVHRVKPTILIGASGAAGTFPESAIREMASQCERPIIFILSHPSVRAEARAADILEWTDGRALLATGSSCAPVTYRGVTYVLAHLSNAMLYPGLGLGAIVSRASRISDGMFAAAASAVSSQVSVRQIGSSLLPHIDNLRSLSVTVAVAVAEKAVAEGLARVKFSDVEKQVQDAMWRPEYTRIEAS